MKVVHVITGLDVGGAETMLYKLVTTAKAFESEVIAIGGRGPMGDRLRAAGVPVRTLDLRLATAPFAFLRLVRWLRSSGADVVQTWMYHSDLVGGLAAWMARKPVVWNLRASRLEKDDVKRSTLSVIKICAKLSRRLPERIVCCSIASEEAHRAAGYAPEKMTVIPNGFDSALFRPDDEARRAIRTEIGVDNQTLLVGLVARFDPLKDHRTFLRAASAVVAADDRVEFVLAGKGVTPDNQTLMSWMDERLRGRIHLLGYRPDVARINATLDVAVCSSSTEGFPNVVGEAMACAVPCAVTDVGDSASIVGETGVAVPPGDPEALARGVLRLLEMPDADRRELGLRARERVSREFALPDVVRRYEALYESVAARKL
jgi:glycosyltransferase involved in cell wall biosynthesis